MPKDNSMLNNNNNNTEIWKPAVGFETLYEVSNMGNVRNMRGKVLAKHIINSGYHKLAFTVNNKTYNKLVHRLVAEAFLPNPDNLREVNHINEDKLDNRLSNLEWVSSSANTQHSIATGTYAKIFEMKNSLGKKHLPNPTSKYHNVTYDKSRSKWVGQVRYQKKNWYMKRFNTEEEAALHVNWIIDTLGLTDRPKNVII